MDGSLLHSSQLNPSLTASTPKLRFYHCNGFLTSPSLNSTLSAAHQNLVSKIFCLCCDDCEEPQVNDNPKAPNQTQEKQPLNLSLQQRKDELKRRNSKRASTEYLIRPEKRTSSSSSEFEFEDLNSQASQGRFYKRNLNRYRQEHWPFEPCRIGRP
ncbi:testis-expressed protein 48 [Ctenodactylus gundi]